MQHTSCGDPAANYVVLPRYNCLATESSGTNLTNKYAEVGFGLGWRMDGREEVSMRKNCTRSPKYRPWPDLTGAQASTHCLCVADSWTREFWASQTASGRKK